MLEEDSFDLELGALRKCFDSHARPGGRLVRSKELTVNSVQRSDVIHIGHVYHCLDTVVKGKTIL